MSSTKKKTSSDDDEERKKSGDEERNNGSETSSSGKKYKGVRKVYGNKYTAIMTIPKQKKNLFGTHDYAEKKTRSGKRKSIIYLGAYDSAEKAARAHDAATVCLYGPQPEVLRYLHFPDTPPEIRDSDGPPFSDEKINEIARRHGDGPDPGPVEPALVTGEPSNGEEVEGEKEEDDPNFWSFMDKDQNGNSYDWSLVDALASPVLPRQAGLDFSGYDFLPLSEPAPWDQVLDYEEEDIRLWNFSD